MSPELSFLREVIHEAVAVLDHSDPNPLDPPDSSVDVNATIGSTERFACGIAKANSHETLSLASGR